MVLFVHENVMDIILDVEDERGLPFGVRSRLLHFIVIDNNIIVYSYLQLSIFIITSIYQQFNTFNNVIYTL